MSPLIYTGIGSRKTPDDVCDLMRRVAERLAARGYILRSGAAEGADAAFEAGARAKEIYLPWRRFNGHSSPLHDLDALEQAKAIASTIHPRWRALKESEKLLHARNVFQVLGADLSSPSAFVVCWTKDGVETEKERRASTGGTGSAIALASSHGVPVINMANPGALDRIKHLVDAERHRQPTKANPPMPTPSMSHPSEHVLPPSAVAGILQAHGESCNTGQICHFSSLLELATRAASSRSWAAGEIFVFAESADRFTILKQLAPSSCEMLVVTANGAHDVLTAYRFTPEELAEEAKAYMDKPQATPRERP